VQIGWGNKGVPDGARIKPLVRAFKGSWGKKRTMESKTLGGVGFYRINPLGGGRKNSLGR